ncbi:MAG: cation transporter [Devosia sp.]|nr:cation transporter [Devosia sp.]
MSDGHQHAASFDGMNETYRRRLLIVTAVNIGMFVVEMTGGTLSGSKALQADALDFFADGITYALSLWAIGKAMRVRAGAAMLKGLSLLAMGLWVGGTTLYQVLMFGVPDAEVMSIIAMLALGANLFSVWLLLPYKDGDSNVRSVWLCSRNDAIGNVAVVVAAGLVALFHSGAPDLIVAGVMAALFLSSAWQILRQAWGEWRHAGAHDGAGHPH